MKSTDKVILDGLRKTTLKYLSDEDYAQIISAVEKQGLLGLNGAAGRMVKTAVIKHGSHDQKTHGRGGKGGGGAASSSPSTGPIADSRRSETSKKLYNDMVEAEQDISDLGMRLDTNPQTDAAQIARQKVEGATTDFFEAQKLTGKAQTKKLQSGVNKIIDAQNALVKVDDAQADNILQRMTQAVQSSLGESSRSVFDKLGVDADAIFLD